MRSVSLFAPVLAALLLTACGGPTADDVVQDYKPRIDAVRARIAQAAISLPEQGTSATEAVAVANPPPVFDVTKPETTNTAFVAIEDLVGEEPVFPLRLQGALNLALAWTGPKNPMSEGTKGESGERFTPQFDAALATRYAALYRTVAYAKPVAVDEKSFEGGTADLEVFLVQIEGANTIAVCRIQGQSATEVSYSYKKGDDPKAKLEAFANSTLSQDVRTELAACLRQTTGSTFVFDTP